jgi:2-polyprenyl-3-methyl-5-hydroxy-6-metoxy-1,4-benzoquinol methylase
MLPEDQQTLAFYAAEARAYASRPRSVDHMRLNAFLAMLPAGGAILELGCGGGQDSEAMLAKGFDVTPTDGSPELACETGRRLGMRVRTLLFGDLDETDRYHGVWASACLLHVSRLDLPAVAARVHAALRAVAHFMRASSPVDPREGTSSGDTTTTHPGLDSGGLRRGGLGRH